MPSATSGALVATEARTEGQSTAGAEGLCPYKRPCSAQEVCAPRVGPCWPLLASPRVTNVVQMCQVMHVCHNMTTENNA